MKELVPELLRQRKVAEQAVPTNINKENKMAGQ